MLANYPVGPAIPVSNVERARRFYEEKLGLGSGSRTPDGGYTYECGDGTRLAIYPTPSAGKAQHTLAGWEVDDLDAVMADLRGRGVVFEEYNMPNLKTVKGVATFGASRAAWFKDSEGNILGVFQM